VAMISLTMEENNLQNKEIEQATNQQPVPSTAEEKSRQEEPKKTEVEILNGKLAELEKQSAMYKDQLLRKAAEFDNYKRRTEAEILNFTKFASENVITQLLPVLDDISRSLKSGKESSNNNQAARTDNDPFYKGVELIFSKFLKVLEAQGLKTMETIGKEFNVDYHDALMQIPKADVPPHTIIEEVEKGYLLFDKVIRHAKVIVSSPVEEEVKN